MDMTDKILRVDIKDLFMDDPLFDHFVMENVIFKGSETGIDLVNFDRVDRSFALTHDLSDFFPYYP